eukprot:gnl/Spiro4/21391_TR10460_c0_g1_i1.p1 gnl/Spiro4/21391_TR10460_c0_g1~~gnl/Spiro4/21391_TR10460_c0_g1_i1.p1  ORF type:complete len:239 (+),score=61.97 gnl/Spiro4/21391_TR10460_c0_g1_i1:83-799(+)
MVAFFGSWPGYLLLSIYAVTTIVFLDIAFRKGAHYPRSTVHTERFVYMYSLPLCGVCSIMAATMGTHAMEAGHTTLWFVYADHFVSAPLMIFGLVLLTDTPITLAANNMGLAALGYVCLATGSQSDTGVKWAFLTFAALFFAASCLSIAATSVHRARGGKYGYNKTKVMICFGLYAGSVVTHLLVWIIGNDGMKVWSFTIDAIIYTCTDVVFKIVFPVVVWIRSDQDVQVYKPYETAG